MSIVSSAMDLPTTGGESNPKQKTKERLAKWYREHGKAKRAQKRIRQPEPADSDAEDYVSGSDDDPPRSVRRALTNEQTDAVRQLIAENTPNTMGALASAAVCGLGAFGIGRAALQNKTTLMSLATSFLGQLGESLTEKPKESAAPSSVLPLAPLSPTESLPSSSAGAAENVDV